MLPLSNSAWLTPVSEPDRLQALHQYNIMPRQQEPIFDELVRLTAQIFRLPISLIALVDAKEVAYKANQGLPGLQQQAREEAICAMVIRQPTPLVFTNLNQPIQLQRLTTEAAQAAQAKNLQFYAGAPLRTPIHHLIGTLCVIGHEPRSFSEPEQQMLVQLAGLVSELITIRHICLTHDKITQRERWQALQALVVAQTRPIVELVRYLWGLLAQAADKTSVPLGVLRPVSRRLNDLHELLQHHHPGPIWYSPPAAESR